MREKISAATLAATCFGIGYARFAPGTIASLVTVPVAWVVLRLGGPVALALAAIVIFALGVWAAGVYVKRSERADASEIVVDEVAGQMFALVLAQPDQWWHFAVGFVLFRIFDIFKPWPVSWADRRVAGGLGVMLDDLLAGLYVSLLLYLIVRLAEAGYFN